MSIDLSPYRAAASTTISSTTFNNFLTALQTLLNGNLDDSDLAAGAGIQISKLLAYPSDATKLLRGDGSWLGVPYCYAIASGTSVAADTLTALAFDGETVDVDAMHDNVTNNTRLTCKTAGVFLIQVAAYSAAGSPGGTSQLGLYKNGSLITGTRTGAAAGDGFVGAGRGSTFTLVSLAVNDYVEAKVDVHGGGTVTVEGSILAVKVS